ncbi:MAG TPA: N-6 DNA methylase [Nevskiaceae bacterium]|nr:N-6 DNA methylase [Nevskiaceae bacterium]
MTERVTDDFIFSLLRAANIKYIPDGSKLVEVREALLSASKAGTGKSGRPEFTAQVSDFLIVGEDKKSLSLQAKYIDDGQSELDDSADAIQNYAVNGALHYARHIAKHTNFKQVFAFGCSGNEKHYRIQPIFVSEEGAYKILKEVDNFENFSASNIDRYYHEQVLGEEPKEIKELKDILSRARRLHEDLRNYANLGETEKPLVVSAILLALNEDGNIADRLTGDGVTTDGQKIFDAVDAHMKRAKVEPQVKREKVINQFNIIKDRDILSVVNQGLGKTPLKYFTEYLKSYVIEYTKNNSPEDVLGRFYGEFMSYSGGDGQSLGVVLTPRHVTELFCDLVGIKPTDKLFDPCCGTGGFLIAGMHHMLEQAKDEEQKFSIKKNQIYGIEIREDMFSVATTNMILRGDGKSNLTPGDFLAQDTQTLREKDFTVGFMNPPYSQAKNKETAHLSEINFISHLLDSMGDEARVVVIVPQSTMVGKTKEDKIVKADILKRHTLEGVITLNKNTFYGVGTNACIAVFTAHKPHPTNLYAKFINFEDDGFEVNKHIGLIETERAKEKRLHLLDCWLHNKDAESRFMVKTKVEADDEWLHSFYYFNDETPTDADFEKTMADYLTFEFSTILQGKGYLFDLKDEDDADALPQ